jgi:hypothetical protein
MAESPVSIATSLVDSFTVQLAESYPGAISGFLPQRYIPELASARTYGGYHHIPPAFRVASKAIESEAGLSGAELYHKLVIAMLIARFGEPRVQTPLPESVAAQYDVEFRRILAQLDTNPSGFYVLENDLFNKDLAICRGKLIPCGAELVDAFSGVPRRIASRGGVEQFVSVLRFFYTRSRGFRPFYELHMDPRARREFTAEGWDRCFLRIADMLEMNPNIKGVFGSSWWYDPEVERITPRIGYLRQRPLQNGATVFRMGSDQAAIINATSFSRIRRELYDKGEYLPTNYLMAWARDDLLGWAKHARAEGLQA